jgi:hypothetical protein
MAQAIPNDWSDHGITLHFHPSQPRHGSHIRGENRQLEENQPQMNGMIADQKREMDWHPVE